MNEANTLVEYGTTIDPKAMVAPPDVTELELEPGHPGLGDDGYVARRKELFALVPQAPAGTTRPAASSNTPPKRPASGARSARSSTNCTASTPARSTCKAKDDLAITQTEIPQLRTISERLERETQHAPRPGRGCAALPHLLRVHRRARVPGHAVHPARLAPGVHARAGHDPRLPGPRPAADEPGLRRTAHAHRQGGRDHAARRSGARPQAVQLVQHRVRADRGAGRDEGVRRRHPVAARARSRTRCSRRTRRGGRSSPRRSSRPTTTRRRCRRTSSSPRRCRSCGANWKHWCAGSAFRCCETSDYHGDTDDTEKTDEDCSEHSRLVFSVSPCLCG